MSSLRTLRRDVARKVRQVGLLGALQHSSAKLVSGLRALGSERPRDSEEFDLKYGTDTAQMVSVGALDIPDYHLYHAVRYEPIVPAAFLEAMQALPIAFEDFVFVDIGSGKGRALLLAAGFAFKQVVGIEISKALTETARKNIALFHPELRKCSDIRLVCDDASNYQLPAEKVVVYFYNPFDEHIMRRLLENIEKSLQASPRKIYVIYQQPLHRKLWEQSAAFKEIKSTPGYIICASTAS